jgi:hypothetical protein
LADLFVIVEKYNFCIIPFRIQAKNHVPLLPSSLAGSTINASWRFASYHSDWTPNGWHERERPLADKRIVLFKDLVMNATNGVKIKPGQRVLIVLKKTSDPEK